MSGDTITSRSLAARAPENRRIRLSRRWHKTTLAAHIISAGAWIGVDVIVAVLVITGRFSGDPALRSLAYRALAAFVVWPMLAAGLLAVAKPWGRIRRRAGGAGHDLRGTERRHGGAG